MRNKAILALRGRTSAAALDLIENAMNDSSLAAAAAEALAGRNDGESLVRIKKLMAIRDQAVLALVGRKDEASLSLIERIINAERVDSVKYAYAVHALVSRSDDQSLDLVERLMRSTQASVRNAMIQSLQKRSDERSLNLLLSALEKRERFDHTAVLTALGYRRDRTSLKILRAAIDAHGGYYSTALEALANRTDAAAEQIKREFLRKSKGGRVDYLFYSSCANILGDS